MISGVLAAAFSVAVVFGAERPATAPSKSPATQAAAPSAAPPAVNPKAALSDEERIGQLMLVTLQGLYAPNNDDRILLRNFTPGGVMMPLAAQPSQAAQYVQDLHKNRLEAKGIPLLIGTDIYSLTRHDSRISSTFIQFPSMMAVSAATDPAAAERLANLISDHLIPMGFNLNMGPALSLSPTLSDADGALDTLGSDATFAGEAGLAMLRAFKERGIIAMPTGFPGGAANHNGSEPATILTPAKDVEKWDLLPYRQAIDAGAPIIHVGNILAPSLDSSLLLASLSPAIMRDLLRNKLGYKGVIVAGPMDGSEIKQLYDPSEAALKALLAGADMLYWSLPGEHVRKSMERIAAALADGTLPPAILQSALAHVLEMKAANMKPPAEIEPAKADKLSKSGKFADESYEIERRSITVVKNDGSILPLSKEGSFPLGVTGVAGVTELRDALQEYMKPVMQQPIRTAARLGDIEDFEIARLTEGSGIRTAVCVLTDTVRMQGQMRLIRELKKKGMAVVVVALGDPRNIAYYAEADAIVAAYCESTQIDASIRAAADILAGHCPIRIKESAGDIVVKAGIPAKLDAAKVVTGPSGRLPVSTGPFAAGTGLSYDVGALIKKAEWDFGDGEKAKGIQVEHTYAAPGKYTLTLQVATPNGDTCQGTFQVRAD
jgi:beta-N-acetylhexosaminidase